MQSLGFIFCFAKAHVCADEGKLVPARVATKGNRTQILWRKQNFLDAIKEVISAISLKKLV
jgi:hypothetical protein